MFNIEGVEPRQDIKVAIIETPFSEIELKANKILPAISVSNPGGNIPTIPAGENQRTEDGKRGKSGSYKRVEYSISEETFSTWEEGFEVPVDTVNSKEMEDYFSEEMVSAEVARNTLWLQREKQVSDAVFNTTTFSGSNAQVVSSKWNNSDTSVPTPFTDVDNAVERMRAKLGIPRGQLSLILTDRAIRYVVRTDELLNDIKYTRDILAKSRDEQLQFLADFFHVKNVIEVSSMENTSEMGVQANFGRIWDTSYGMVAKLSPETNSWKVGGLGRQPSWGKVAKDYVIESYDEKSTNRKWMRARDYKGQKVFSKFGCLLTGVIA